MKKKYICIVCPNSCRLTVEERDGGLIVTGNACPRGEAYGKKEFGDPERMLTSTVRIEGALHPMLPVVGSREIPKSKIIECLRVVYGVCVAAPVRCGDVIIKDICGTGADLLASRSMGKREVDQ